MAGISILPFVVNNTVNPELDYKQNRLVSGSNIKTINNESILGAGNLEIDTLPEYLNSVIVLAPLSNAKTIINAFKEYNLDKKVGQLIPVFIKKESFDKNYTFATLVVEDYNNVGAGWRLTFTIPGTKSAAKYNDMESIYSPNIMNNIKLLSYLYSESMGYVIPLGEGEIKDKKVLDESKRYIDTEVQKLNKHLSESLEDVGVSEETVTQIISKVQSSLSDDIENISNQVENINKQVENINSNKITPIIKISYHSLVHLRNNAKLIPGQQYRITDYVTTTSQQSTASANHQFDIIVTADNEYTLNENARAIQHEGDKYFNNSDLSSWEIKYCLDNDKRRFDWVFDDATHYVPNYVGGSWAEYQVVIELSDSNRQKICDLTGETEISHLVFGPSRYNKFESKAYVIDGKSCKFYININFTEPNEVLGLKSTSLTCIQDNPSNTVFSTFLTDDKIHVRYPTSRKLDLRIRIPVSYNMKQQLSSGFGISENVIPEELVCTYVNSRGLDFYATSLEGALAEDDMIGIVYSPFGWPKTEILSNFNITWLDSSLISIRMRRNVLSLNGQPTDIYIDTTPIVEDTKFQELPETKFIFPFENKGVIYYMKDEWGNECPYDFKNITMKDSYAQSFTFGGDSDMTTLSSAFAKNNIIKPFVSTSPQYIDNLIYYPMQIPRICITGNNSGAFNVSNNVFTDSFNVHIFCNRLTNNEFTGVSYTTINTLYLETNLFKDVTNVQIGGGSTISHASFTRCYRVTVDLSCDLENIEMSLPNKGTTKPYYLTYDKSPSKRKVWLDSNGNLVTYCEDDLISQLLNN